MFDELIFAGAPNNPVPGGIAWDVFDELVVRLPEEKGDPFEGVLLSVEDRVLNEEDCLPLDPCGGAEDAREMSGIVRLVPEAGAVALAEVGEGGAGDGETAPGGSHDPSAMPPMRNVSGMRGE